MNELEKLKKKCFEKRFYSFGTTKIFEKRVKSYRLKLKIIAFLGLLSPVLLGGFVAAFSSDNQILTNILLPVCGLLTILQAIMSLWSLVSKWDDVHAYSISAVKNNTRLTNDFDQLTNQTESKIKRDFPRLFDEFNRQEIEDTAQSVTTKEKRFAMRESLFQYKNKCPTCNKIPETLTPSNCDTCGNY